ncbi:MAG: CRISPR-associated endonuclease Cas2 [Desulfovibrio sp.]|nr:CRISPR-associated endonuclease Cas2 [Desulfovibrio sp.]
MSLYLITYDVTRDADREKVAKRLKKHGRRLQKSVFLIEATDAALENLSREILKIIDDEDGLLIFPLCESCFEKALTTDEDPDLLSFD